MTISETLNISGLLIKLTNFKKTTTQIFSLTDTITSLRKVIVNRIETFNLSGSVTVLKKFYKTITETIKLTQIVSFGGTLWAWAKKNTATWVFKDKH